MNPQPTNRLKAAMDSVAAPPELAASIRSRLNDEQSESEVSRRLRSAVKSAVVPPFLEARVRNQIRLTDKPPRFAQRWVYGATPAVAAALFAAFFIPYHYGHFRVTAGSKESYIAAVSTQVSNLIRVGLGDHIHCSVFRKYPKNAPSTEEFVKKMDPHYAALIPIVKSQVPESFRMTLAHECQYHRRRFIHLSLMDDSNILSLVITRKKDGESFQADGLSQALVHAGIPMYQSGIQRFQVTAFETSGYLVYFVSDLPKSRNTEYMLAMGPAVKEFLSTLQL